MTDTKETERLMEAIQREGQNAEKLIQAERKRRIARKVRRLHIRMQGGEK